MAIVKTHFDGRRALIIGDHPHGGETAICLGAEKTLLQWALRFRDIAWGEEFFVFEPKHVEWLPINGTPQHR